MFYMNFSFDWNYVQFWSTKLMRRGYYAINQKMYEKFVIVLKYLQTIVHIRNVGKYYLQKLLHKSPNIHIFYLGRS